MALQMHLNKSGSGMASRTACGRNILRTPLCCVWSEFTTPAAQQCATSKQAELNARMGAKK